jgi:hypothetical protein
MSPASSKKTSCTFNTFIQSLHSAWSLPSTLEGGKNHNSANTWQRTKISPNLHLISLLSTMGKLSEKLISRRIQNHNEERNLLNASQSDFRADHSMILQCMRLKDHITLNFNNNTSMTAVFLDIMKAFDTTWHSGLLYKL